MEGFLRKALVLAEARGGCPERRARKRGTFLRNLRARDCRGTGVRNVQVVEEPADLEGPSHDMRRAHLQHEVRPALLRRAIGADQIVEEG